MTNFPKIFPLASLKQVVEIAGSDKLSRLTREEFIQVVREATFTLGTLVTYLGKEVPQVLTRGSQEAVVKAVEKAIAEKGQAACSRYGVLTSEEVCACITLCQGVIASADMAAEPVVEKIPAPLPAKEPAKPAVEPAKPVKPASVKPAVEPKK